MVMRGPITGTLHTSADIGPLPVLVESYCLTSDWHSGSTRIGYSSRTVSSGEAFFVPWGLGGKRGCRIVFQHPRFAIQSFKFERSFWQSVGEVVLEPPVFSGLDFDTATRAAQDHVHRGGTRYFTLLQELGYGDEISSHADAEMHELHRYVEKWRTLAIVRPATWPKSTREVMNTLRTAERTIAYTASLYHLCRAAGNRGSPQKLQTLVQQGGYVNGWCEKGGALLTKAIYKGGIEKIDILLSAGASLDDPWMFSNETAVSWAGRFGNLNTLVFIAERSNNHQLHHSVDGLLGDKLVQAAARGQIDLLRRYIALRSATLTIDLRSRTGATALHGAFSGGQIPVVQLLLDSGADPTVVTHTGKGLQDYVTEPGLLSERLTELGLLDHREQTETY